MNENEFVQQAQQEESVATFLTEIADEVRGDSSPQRFGLGILNPMQLAAAYAVWSLLRLGIVSLRTLIGIALAERTGEAVEFLVAKGYPRKTAEATVATTLEYLRNQSDDSPILKALLKLLPGNTPPKDKDKE